MGKGNARQNLTLVFGGILIFACGVYLKLLLLTGSIFLYIHPRFALLTELSSWSFILVGIVSVVFYVTRLEFGRALFAMSGRRALGLLANNALVILFVLAAFLLPAQSLSADIAGQRGQQFNFATQGQALSIVERFVVDSKSYEIDDWVRLLAVQPDPQEYVGKEVRIVGFVYAGNGLPSDEFLAGRYVISCCVVDATPVGLRVYLPDWRQDWRHNDWVEVTGRFDVRDSGTQAHLVVVPDRVVATEVPENPYIY